MSALFIGLMILAILSPLLTFTALFQQKEWRLDRLKEHLRRDGWANQLFGKLRPVLVGIWFFIEALGSAILPLVDTLTFDIAWVALFALLSITQFALRRQRMPVWTFKAMIIVALALALNVASLFILFAAPLSLPLLIIAQPLIVLLAWVLFKPVDSVMKKRVMDRAAKLRSSLKDATVIGLAGSVGKTTVKELIAHLLQDLNPMVTPAHVNTEMGVAQWLTSKLSGSQPIAHGSQLFIIEMGAYAKGEIALLCRIAQPTIGVMTALGSDHLALFGSEDAIIEANKELIDALPETGHAFFYGDNHACRELSKKAPCPVTVADEVSQFPTPLHGKHNEYNSALAISVARHLGIKDDRIAELLKTFKPTAHTFDVRQERGILLLDDTYNISPLSLKAAIEWASTQTKRPRILLTSGLQETGSEEARILKEIGEFAKGKIERAIFIGEHGSKAFAEGFGAGVEVLSASTQPAAKDSALLAVGRMPLSTVQRLLPQ